MERDSPPARRRLFAASLVRMGVDCALISNPKHIFYLSGADTNTHPWQILMKGPRLTSFLAVDRTGGGSLLLGATDDVARDIPGVARQAYRDYDLQDTMVVYGDRLAEELRLWFGEKFGRAKRIAVEDWHLPQAYSAALVGAAPGAELVGVSGALLGMRASKGEDEVRSVRSATEIVESGFAVARTSIAEGASELEVYAEVDREAFRKYGHAAWINGDFASGEGSLAGGGPPTPRRLSKGNTIILDLHAASRNYWSDLCRTFVIGSPSTHEQERVFEALSKAKEEGERRLLPGTKGRDVYEAVSGALEKDGFGRLPHHAGHGVGLDDQEPPWFIPGEERRLQEGAVVALEPGIYSAGSGGIRIEDIYVVRKAGPERLSRFPLGLD
jgi:Xaa-Pro aminopeptidase